MKSKHWKQLGQDANLPVSCAAGSENGGLNKCSFEDQNQGHEHLESCYTKLPYLHSNINNIGMVREEIMEKSYREILMSWLDWSKGQIYRKRSASSTASSSCRLENVFWLGWKLDIRGQYKSNSRPFSGGTWSQTLGHKMFNLLRVQFWTPVQKKRASKRVRKWTRLKSKVVPPGGSSFGTFLTPSLWQICWSVYFKLKLIWPATAAAGILNWGGPFLRACFSYVLRSQGSPLWCLLPMADYSKKRQLLKGKASRGQVLREDRSFRNPRSTLLHPANAFFRGVWRFDGKISERKTRTRFPGRTVPRICFAGHCNRKLESI